MEFPILNKFEKEQKVIELHIKEGKTLKEISQVVHMSFRDISKIIKAYDKKIRLQSKKAENSENNPLNQKIKKQSKCSQAYALFLQGKKQVDVAIDLQLDFEKVRKYWKEFLRLNNMKKLYNIYIENEFHLDSLFRIYYFMRRNEIPIQDMENVLRIAYDTTKLYQIHSNLKTGIEQLKQTKNNYSLNKNTNNYQQPVPLGPLPRYYNWSIK